MHLYGGCCRCLLSPALKFIRPLLLYSLPFFDSTVPYSFLNNSARFSSGKSSKLDGNLFSFNQSESKSTKNRFCYCFLFTFISLAQMHVANF